MGTKLRNFFYKSYITDGEEIMFVIHRHLFLELKNFFKVFFFGLFLPVFAWWLFPKLLPLTILWGVIGVVRFLYEFFDWYYDAWLVTNVSVVEVIWEGFFKKSSARIEYHIIQGIGYEIKGIFRTLFNYGSITLEKFTGHPSTFDGAISPKKKVEMLTRAQDEFVKHKNYRDHHALQGLLSDLLQQHVLEHGVPGSEDEKS
ncbi:hypothetical protein KBD59_03455 [Candidatus Gracilibacteria bacterium]|nr:hypothetical protein [Candidatus Gracilibacteria bacterium]